MSRVFVCSAHWNEIYMKDDQTCCELEARLDHLRQVLLRWYEANGRSFPWRDEGRSPYELIVTEVLLQRTRAGVVGEFWGGFFQAYPDWCKLAAATQEELSFFLRPLGLWRRRADTLRHLAQVMVCRRGCWPKQRDDLEDLPGVGQYIANAALLLCHDERHPLLDTNMARLLERYFGSRKLADIRDDPYLQELAYRLVRCGEPKAVNWAVLDYAAMVCRPRNPECQDCQARGRCEYAMNT